MSEFSMSKDVLRQIEDYCNKMNLVKTEINILDWGCGRGRAVIWLRAHGYNAFGVDIDSEPVNNGKKLLAERGLNPDAILSVLDDNGKSKSPDGFFHFIFADGVFEHVRDIETVASEFQRLLRPGCGGLGFYPAHKHLVEAHLYMPFVHWFPKNKLRKLCILLFLLLGRNPKWKELKEKPLVEQAQRYYEYSANKTYYRDTRTMTDIFERNRFKVNFLPIATFSLERHPKLSKLVKIKPLRPILNWAMCKFGQVGLLLTKQES